MLFPMLTRRLTERTVRACRLTMVWSAYFWCNPIRFQSAASLIRCRLLARRSIGLPIGWSLRLTGPPQTPPPDRAGGFCSPPAPMTPPSPRADTLRCDLEWTHGDGPSPGDSRPLPRVARAVAVRPGPPTLEVQVSKCLDWPTGRLLCCCDDDELESENKLAPFGKRSFSTNHFAACDAAQKICCRIRKQIYGTQSGNFEKKPNSFLPEIPAVCGVGQLSALLRFHVQFGLASFDRAPVPFSATVSPGLSNPGQERTDGERGRRLGAVIRRRRRRRRRRPRRECASPRSRLQRRCWRGE